MVLIFYNILQATNIFLIDSVAVHVSTHQNKCSGSKKKLQCAEVMFQKKPGHFNGSCGGRCPWAANAVQWWSDGLAFIFPSISICSRSLIFCVISLRDLVVPPLCSCLVLVMSATLVLVECRSLARTHRVHYFRDLSFIDFSKILLEQVFEKSA